jgi:pyrimidine operon attenuation protein/uracil phosphoribosyltransferase
MKSAFTHRTGEQVQTMVDSMADAILRDHQSESRLALVGIQQKGVLLARAIHQKLQATRSDLQLVFGELDVGLYRDDLSSNPAPVMNPTMIPESLEDAVLILVDDVIQSGRTIRAALDAILDFGRPRRIQLAVLFDRGQRQLPIQPDYVGEAVELKPEEFIILKTLEAGSGLEVCLTQK